MIEKIKKTLIRFKYELIIITIVSIVYSALGINGFYNTHDGCYHIARAYRKYTIN